MLEPYESRDANPQMLSEAKYLIIKSFENEYWTHVEQMLSKFWENAEKCWEKAERNELFVNLKGLNFLAKFV